MPQFRRGDMWVEWPNTNIVWLATTNAVIKNNGELVMGKGNALTMAQKILEAPRVFAEHIKKTVAPWRYYLILKSRGSLSATSTKFGAFQTKCHWKEPSQLDLIQEAASRLTMAAKAHPEYQFYLPFPGIGNGGLKRENVLPLLQDLPENVIIWEK